MAARAERSGTASYRQDGLEVWPVELDRPFVGPWICGSDQAATCIERLSGQAGDDASCVATQSDPGSELHVVPPVPSLT